MKNIEIIIITTYKNIMKTLFSKKLYTFLVLYTVNYQIYYSLNLCCCCDFLWKNNHNPIKNTNKTTNVFINNIQNSKIENTNSNEYTDIINDNPIGEQKTKIIEENRENSNLNNKKNNTNNNKGNITYEDGSYYEGEILNGKKKWHREIYKFRRMDI